MKLSRKPSKIVGVRVGEASINLLTGFSASVKFVLLKDAPAGENINAGSYTKTQWSPKTIEALTMFIESAEEDALADLFDEQGQGDSPQETPEEKDLSFPPVPFLGGPKR